MDLPEELKHLLVCMRRRPGMYLPGRSYLPLLEAFINGYSTCDDLQGRASPLRLGIDFSSWLTETKGLIGGPSLAWSRILSQSSNSDDEAYNRFFDLLAEFRGWPPLE